MSVTFNRVVLRDAVRLASKVLSAKPVTRLGKAVILRGGNAFAQGDHESAEVAAPPIKGEIECQVTASDLLARLDASAEDEVTLDATPGSLVVKAKRSKWTLQTVALERNPSTVDLAKVAFEVVDAGPLKRAIEATLPASGIDPATPNNFGVCFLPGGRVTATDGRRIHLFHGGPKVSEPTTITPQFAKLLLGIKSDAVRMFVGPKEIVVSIDGATFSHRQLGVPFVPVDNAIVAVRGMVAKGKVATVGSAALVEAIEAAALAAEFGQVTIEVRDGMLTVTGRLSGDVSHCELAGDMHEMNANAGYLVAAVRAFGSDSVDMHTPPGDLHPTMMVAAGTGLDSECVIVTPTRK